MFKNDVGNRREVRVDAFSCVDKQKVALAYTKKTKLIKDLEKELGVVFKLEETISKFEYHSVNDKGYFIRIGGLVGSERQYICILSNKNQKLVYNGDIDKDAVYYTKLIKASYKLNR